MIHNHLYKLKAAQIASAHKIEVNTPKRGPVYLDNIIGDKDWPSKLCNGGEQGIREAQESATIQMVEQTETQLPIGGHYFVQPDYQEKIRKIIEGKIIGNYEIY